MAKYAAGWHWDLTTIKTELIQFNNLNSNHVTSFLKTSTQLISTTISHPYSTESNASILKATHRLHPISCKVAPLHRLCQVVQLSLNWSRVLFFKRWIPRVNLFGCCSNVEAELMDLLVWWWGVKNQLFPAILKDRLIAVNCFFFF